MCPRLPKHLVPFPVSTMLRKRVHKSYLQLTMPCLLISTVAHSRSLLYRNTPRKNRNWTWRRTTCLTPLRFPALSSQMCSKWGFNMVPFHSFSGINTATGSVRKLGNPLAMKRLPHICIWRQFRLSLLPREGDSVS